MSDANATAGGSGTEPSAPPPPPPVPVSNVGNSIPVQNHRPARDDTIDDEDRTTQEQEDDMDEDELFEQLENDEYGMANFREQRIEELREEVEKRKLIMEQDGGSYKEITNEKEVMDITTKSKTCVIHFFHADFRRCMIVDRHLETLAKKHLKTRFVKIKVENAPFLVEKLQVKVLPCVISFKDSQVVDRLIGFEELGNTDNFSTTLLELRYKTCGLIEDKEKKDAKNAKKKSIFGRDYGSDEGTDDEY